MRIKVLTASILLAVCICGCAVRQPETTADADAFRLYWFSQEQDNAAGAIRWSAAGQDFMPDVDAAIQRCFSEAFRQPESASFLNGLSYTQCSADNGFLTIEMGDEYTLLTDSERTLADACITLTMLQLDSVQSVRIVGSGTENTYGTDSFLLQDNSAGVPEVSVSLYFAYGGSRLTRETGYFICGDPQQLPELTMQALLKGPHDQKHYSTIPENTQLLDVSVEDGVCTVILSNDFAEVDESGQRAVLAVRSITSTLCALDGIDAVRIQMPDGMGLQHASIGEPLRSEPQWIR